MTKSHQNHLDWAGALSDIEKAAKYLKQELHAPSVTVIGFCMGGALTLNSVCGIKEVDAGICFCELFFLFLQKAFGLQPFFVLKSNVFLEQMAWAKAQWKQCNISSLESPFKPTLEKRII